MDCNEGEASVEKRNNITEKNKDYKNFYHILSMDKEKDILVVDPFVINMKDVHVAAIKNVLRVRRPFWGKGNLSEFINKVNPEDLKEVLAYLNIKEEVFDEL